MADAGTERLRRGRWRRRESRLTEYSFASLCRRTKKCPVTRLQARVYATIFSALFLNAFIFTMLFPFLPFMVQFLLPDVQEADIGKYAGIIGAAMFIGRFFGSYTWGALADRKGRKSVLIVSNVLMAVFAVAFGFSVNFPMAVLLRFFTGLSNGMVGTAKAVISEASDDRTQALGLSITITAFGLGLIFGPAVSGAIADPIGQYNLNISSPVLHSFLVRFPYSLPCLVSGLISIATTVILLLCLPETLGMKKKKQQVSPQVEEEDEEEEEEEEGEGGRNREGEGERGRKGEGEEEEEEGERASHLLEVETSINEDQAVDLGMLRWLPFDGDIVDGDGVGGDGVSGDGVRGGGEVVNLIANASTCAGRSASKEMAGDKPSEYTLEGAVTDVDMTSMSLETVTEEEEEEGDRVVLVRRESGDKDRGRSNRRRRSSVLFAYLGRRGSFSPSFIKLPRRQSWRVANVERRGGEEEEEEEEGEEEEEEEMGRRGRWKRWVRDAGRSTKMALRDLKLLLMDRVVVLAILSYCTFGFAVIGFDEVFPIWAATSRSLGGLGFSLHEIGIAMAIVGAVLLPFSMFLYAGLERYFKSTGSFFLATLAAIVAMVILPNMHLLVEHTIPMWILLLLLMLVIRVGANVCFAATSLFVNNSVTFDQLGTVNGLNMTFVALSRSFSPLFSGGIYAVSLTTTVGFPFDYHLIFTLFGVTYIIAIVIVAFLPKSINRQKTE